MLTRRGPRLLAIVLQSALPADAASAHAASSSLQLLPVLAAVTASRAYNTSSFWDVPSHTADLYLELDTIRSMLPNRSTFTPQFTPHGIMLMPNSSLQPMPVELQQQAEVAAAAADADEPEPGLWADSVKRKRRMKMKRHKLKKRRKLARHQQ